MIPRDRSIAGGCLRISYVDQVDRKATQDGLLVVWPMGFGTRTADGVVEVTGPDGRVVAAAGQTLRLSGKKVSDQLVSADEWVRGGGEVGQGCVDKSTPVPDYGYRNPKNAITDISCGSTNTPTPGADAPVPIDEVRDETARSCQRQNH